MKDPVDEEKKHAYQKTVPAKNEESEKFPIYLYRKKKIVVNDVHKESKEQLRLLNYTKRGGESEWF